MICLTCRVCHARCDFRVFFSLSYPAAECMLLAGSLPAANAALVPARCRWVGRVVPASDRQQVTLRLARPYSGVSPSSLTVRLFPDLRVRVSAQTLHHVLDGFRLINLFPYFLPLIRCNLAAGVWADDTTLSFLSPCFSVQIRGRRDQEKSGKR